MGYFWGIFSGIFCKNHGSMGVSETRSRPKSSKIRQIETYSPILRPPQMYVNSGKSSINGIWMGFLDIFLTNMVSKGNDPTIALFQVSDWYIYIYMYILLIGDNHL